MSTHRPPGSAYEMVMRCFEHQHPDAYDRAPVEEPTNIPPHVRYGPGDTYASAGTVAEEPMGNPEARPL